MPWNTKWALIFLSFGITLTPWPDVVSGLHVDSFMTFVAGMILGLALAWPPRIVA